MKIIKTAQYTIQQPTVSQQQQIPQQQVSQQSLAQKNFEDMKIRVLPTARKFIVGARELYNNWNNFQNEEQLSVALTQIQQSLQLLIASVQQGRRTMQITTPQAVQQVKNPIGQGYQK